MSEIVFIPYFSIVVVDGGDDDDVINNDEVINDDDVVVVSRFVVRVRKKEKQVNNTNYSTTKIKQRILPLWLEEKKRNKKISISNRSNHRSNHSNHKVNRERENFYSVRRKEKVFLKQIVFEQLNLPPPICRKPRGSILKLLPAKKNKKKRS